MTNTDQENTPKTIDMDALQQRFQGRQEFINRLLKLALNEHGDAPEQLETIIQKKDFEELRTFAHTMKGMAANIMAHQLQNVCQAIERKARDHDSDVFESANNMKTELINFINELKNY